MEQVNQDKVTDKALSRLILTSVLGILLCLACLCSITWAWFSKGITSGNTKIETAECTLTVTATDGSTAVTGVDGIGVGETATVELEAGSYQVTVAMGANSASGYCVLSADGTSYYTDYMVGGKDVAQSLTFTLVVTANTSVTFLPHWGIYSTETASVGNNGTLTLPAPTTGA